MDSYYEDKMRDKEFCAFTMIGCIVLSAILVICAISTQERKDLTQTSVYETMSHE